MEFYHGIKHIEENYQKTRLIQIEDSRFKAPIYEIVDKNERVLNIYAPTDSGYIVVDSIGLDSLANLRH